MKRDYVIASRAAARQSSLDCFALLAMTEEAN